jgi:hypothetical protein
MKENRNISSGIPQKNREEKGPKLNLETKLLNLIKELVENNGRFLVLNYIEKNTLGNIYPVVVERWLDEGIAPMDSIQKDILTTLESRPPDKLPIAKRNLVSTPKQEEDISLPFKKPGPKRNKKEQIIKDNEEKLKNIINKLRDEGKII